MTLTIIIPVYNTPINFIQDCLESIKNSSIRYPYEIIMVNDGSTKEEVLQFLEQQQGNIRIIHKANGGLSSARNAAIPYIKGELVLCLDSDDTLLPEINNAIKFLLENKDYDIVYADVQNFGDSNYKAVKGSFSKFKLIYLGHITSATNLFRKTVFSKIGTFNEDLIYAEDWDFWARAASAGFRFKYLPEPYFLYRRIHNGNSLSQKNFDKREEIKSFIKSQFNPHKEITLEEVNKYVVNNFKDNKKHLLKLILLVYLPYIYRLLLRKGIYKNNIIVD